MLLFIPKCVQNFDPPLYFKQIISKETGLLIIVLLIQKIEKLLS